MLRRSLALVPLLAGTTVTWLVASGATQLLGGSLAPLDPHALVSPSRAEPSPAPAPPRALHAAAWIEEAAAPPGSPAPAVASGRCGVGRLVIAAVDPRAPERSLAVVDHAGSKPLVRRGSALDGRRVAFITASRVYLEDREADGDGSCWIGTDAVATRAPTGASGSASIGRPAPPPDPLAPLLDGIHRVDARTLEVDRVVRDALVEHQFELLKELRASPERLGDRVIGMRLGSVRPGSLIDRLGLRAGDRVVSLNGYELSDPGQVLEAYAKLRAAPNLVLGLVRDGEPRSVELQVR